MLHATTGDRSPHRPPYQRHRPEQTLLYQIVEQYYPEFRDAMAAKANPYPSMFSRNSQSISSAASWNMGSCGCNAPNAIMNIWSLSAVKSVVFPSCGARRMAESAALLVDEVLPEHPIRQWRPELSLSIAVSIRQSPGTDGQCTGYCLPRHRYSPDQQGGIHQEDCANRRGKDNPSQSQDDKTPEQQHKAMTWAQRLKRVLNIYVSICTSYPCKLP